MRERKVSFYSEGHKLTGTVYLPDDYQPGEKRPVIIPSSGYQGFNEFYPKLFSRYLTAAGYVCLGFDYRGFAESGGRKGRVILDEQIQDIKNALTFAQIQEETDPERIGLLGWGMGAFNVVQVAAADKRVKAVAALNGFYNGERWLKSIHSYLQWHDILEMIEADRVRRVTTGKSLRTDPFIHYPLDPATNRYVQKELAPLSPFGKKIDLQFTDSIMAMDAEQVAASIAPRPLFIGHGRQNLLHPWEEAAALYESAAQPKELYWIDGKHNDFMYSDHPVFNDLILRMIEFFRILQQQPDVRNKTRPTPLPDELYAGNTRLEEARSANQ
ncbi:alpha/beta hydrolase [Candidatus Parcubacteria bacterium]|nr:alpha/beta hydrolase [Candidatus Parcubacteria bacterium]